MNPEDTFRFQLVGRYRDPLTRQLAEAATIKRAIIGHHTNPQKETTSSVKVKCLNRKNEWFAPECERISKFV